MGPPSVGWGSTVAIMLAVLPLVAVGVLAVVPGGSTAGALPPSAHGDALTSGGYALGAAASTPPQTGPLTTHLSPLHWAGSQLISTATTFRNTSITISGGDLIVASGGALTLDNDTLSISQVNGSGLSALSHGLVVSSGGQLLVKFSSIFSGNGSSYPAFADLAGPVRAYHTGFLDLGGSGSSPVAGREGLFVTVAHADFEQDAFDHTFQVLFDGSGAVGDRIASSAWVNATITGGQVGWVEVAGGASWTNLSQDSWSGTSDAGMLALISGPHTAISNSTFVGDPSGTQPYQVYLTYDGWTDRGVDASYASVVDDRFQTANLGISDGNQFTIERDTFNDTGHWTSTGGAAAIIVVTWIGSGVGEMTRHVDIEHDTVSNFTHYAIRVSQNVSAFNVSSNRIFATRSTYSSAISEADGIYLIRGVNNGTVWNNSLDMTDLVQASEPTNGIVLEAQINDVNVSANRIYNCSEVGITVQGDSGALAAPSYYLGSSSRDSLYDNRLVNFHSVAAQSMYSAEAIETWMWANGTRIVDNYISGWNLVDATDYWNGAGILTSSSEQWFGGNTMVGVRFGFVYEQFDAAQELRSLGSFNRSYNVMDGNLLSGVTVASVAENARDDMGPIVNLISGPVDPTWNFSFSGANATVRLVNATVASFAPSSAYRASNVQFGGPVTLGGLGTAFDFALSQWAPSAPSVRFGAFQAQIGVSTGWYNVSVSNYTAAVGTAQWNATQSGSGSDRFGLLAPVPGTLYGLSVDGTVTTSVLASALPFSLGWTGSGTHRFALEVVRSTVGSAPGPLRADASATHSIGTAPLKIQFAGNASGGTAPYAYSWHFGDGGTSSLASPTHTYAAVGTYLAVLTVTDAKGNRSNASVLIVVTHRLPLSRLGAATSPTVIGAPPSGIVRLPSTPRSPAIAPPLAAGLWLAGVAAAGAGITLAARMWRRAP